MTAAVLTIRRTLVETAKRVNTTITIIIIITRKKTLPIKKEKEMTVENTHH